MTVGEILQNVTIFEDCTAFNIDVFGFIMTGAIFVLGALGLWYYIWKISESVEIWASILLAIMSAAGVAGILTGIFTYTQHPYRIDYYVSINDVEISEIVKYFDVREPSQVNEMTVCHIVPKKEYYDEVLEIRTAGNLA